MFDTVRLTTTNIVLSEAGKNYGTNVKTGKKDRYCTKAYNKGLYYPKLFL